MGALPRAPGGGAAFVSAIHFGPLAVEPPHLIHGGYEQPVIFAT